MFCFCSCFDYIVYPSVFRVQFKNPTHMYNNVRVGNNMYLGAAGHPRP